MTVDLRAEQRGVARGMILGLVVAVAVLALGNWLAAWGPAGGSIETLGAAVAILGLWVAAAIGNVARLRFFDGAAINGAIDGAVAEREVAGVRVGQAVVQNTLEQAVLAGFAYGALAATMTGAAPSIALLAGCFSVGRVMFWAGYARGAAARAFGFALTFYPSVLALLVVLARLIAARLA
ncbi:MAG TPA: MAPEG family protein [Sphingomonas sp.]|nr:MAPEG family protein [Sphingomonas sp.]